MRSERIWGIWALTSEVLTLGEVIHITSGKECPPENKTENSSFPIRGATGIIGYSKKPLYERPIILVGRVGAGLLSGMSGILNRAENPCWPSDNTLVIIPKEEDDFDYIEYCLRYSEIYPYVSGSSQPLLTQTALKLLEIPWPSRETRHIIANNGRQIDQLLLMNNIPYTAKFGGATGNFNAHHVAFPDINWIDFSNDFLKNSLELKRQQITTQIEHYDNLAAIMNNLSRINTVLIDFSRDIWTYVSMDYFKQKINNLYKINLYKIKSGQFSKIFILANLFFLNKFFN